MKLTLSLITLFLLFASGQFSFSTPRIGMDKIVDLSIANDTADAIIMSNMQISLDSNVLLSKIYKANISHLTFNDRKEAEKFFNSYNDNLVSFKVIFEKKELVIHLYPQYNSGRNWSVAEWNHYLEQKAIRIKQNEK